jgi:hypothetical protein
MIQQKKEKKKRKRKGFSPSIKKVKRRKFLIKVKRCWSGLLLREN